MRHYSKALLGGVAALALGGYTSGAANAFDETNWKWDLNILTNISESVIINIDIDPIGKVLDEVVQYQIGDVKATSSISNIYNWKPLEAVEVKSGYTAQHNLTVDTGYYSKNSGSGSGSAWAKGHLTTGQSNTAGLAGQLTTTASPDGDTPFFIGGAGALGGYFVSGGPSGAAGAGVIGAIGAHAHPGEVSFDGSLTAYQSQTNSFDAAIAGGYRYNTTASGDNDFHVNVTEEHITTTYKLVPKLQNALNELPQVSSVSTAIGNMISIETDTPVQESSLQVVFDTVEQKKFCRGEGQDRKCYGNKVDFDLANFDLDADLNVQDASPNLDSNNYNHDVALLLGLAAGAGLIEQADITASAEAYNIWNAQVDATATAIGNLKSINLETSKRDNGLVMADITQLSVANVSADANTHDIHLVNYNNLGKLDDAIAKATATAIGNAVNIKVNSAQCTAPCGTTP